MSGFRFLSALGLGISLLSISGCNGASGTTHAPADPVFDVSWSFNRLPIGGLDKVEVTFNLLKDGVANASNDISLKIENPDNTETSREDIQDRGNGEYFFSISPQQTGEYQINLTYAGKTFTQTPVVLDSIASGWQQPMALQSVNTLGFEGGAHITRDGQWLFIQYSPMSASSNLFLNANSPGCNGDLPSCDSPLVNQTADASYVSIFGINTIRPGFPQGRLTFQSNNTKFANINHNTSFFDDDSIYRPPSAFYGFRRLTDGSYGAAFTLAIGDGNEGVLAAQGLSVSLTSSGLPFPVFAFIDPSQDAATELGDSHLDIYAGAINLGQSDFLTDYILENGNIKLNIEPEDAAKALALPHATQANNSGRQANPYLHLNGNDIDSLWVDDHGNMLDATNLGDISVYKSSGDGNYLDAQLLPAKINTGDKQSQAFFTGNTLYYRQANAGEDYGKLMQVNFSGSVYSDATQWGAPANLLVAGTESAKGSIVTLGDPSIGEFNGQKVLFFTYGKIRENINGFFDIDMQVGYLEAETTP